MWAGLSLPCRRGCSQTNLAFSLKKFPPGVGEPDSETLRKQFAFQSDFWGGPVRYQPWRGHPRMRMRHLPFAIDQDAADTWISCMTAAVEASAMPPAVRSAFLGKMRDIAQAMINR